MQQELLLSIAPPQTTSRNRDGWVLQLTEREVVLLQKPIASTSGGYQSAMREAATCVHPGRKWHVSHSLMLRLYRMCVKQGQHGGYQSRLPLRVLTPIFATMTEREVGTWFYGKQEAHDDSRVKFGKTDNPERRNRDHSTDNPRELVTLFCLWDPTGRYEDAIKAHFETFNTQPKRGRRRARREWFFRSPEVNAFIELCKRVSTTTELPQW